MDRARFLVLFREFVHQFFASESASSDHQVRQAIIGVVAFLLTPGLMLPLQLGGAFEFAAMRQPALLDPLIRLMATIFVTYTTVAMGVIAAFTWEALGFDRRDAMVLGPTPVSSAAIVTAKLAALAGLLLTGAFAVNVIPAVLFALVAANHGSLIGASRHFVAHIAATMLAATFVFSLLVAARALLGMLSAGCVAIASLLQFVLVSASLCFMVLVPRTLRLVGGAPGRRRGASLVMQSIPDWSPTKWFVGVHEMIRGASGDDFAPIALFGLKLTLFGLVAAAIATILSYRRQQQQALTPSASAGVRPVARRSLALARFFAGRDPVARGSAEFVLATLMRNRAQQAPIAMNAAIGVGIIVAALSRVGGDLSTFRHPRTVVLWIPLMFAYWTAVGVRAAFFVPSELPANWTIRANAPSLCAAYWVGTRAAMRAFLIPPVLLISIAVTMPLLGLRTAAWHTAFVGVMLVTLIELIALTIRELPFTSPYRPGHAKLKTRWPLYWVGMLAFAYWPVRAELMSLAGDAGSLLFWPAATALVLNVAGRRAALAWSADATDGDDGDHEAITMLAIAQSGDLVLG